MLVTERRERILQALRDQGRVVASELSETLAVSPDTIRRDLEDLAAAGMLRRVHGGALPRSPGAAQYATRLRQAPAAKAAIARAAGSLLRSGQVILLDGGTTTLRLAEQLPPGLRATVLTNSPAAATALAALPDIEVSVIGGRLHSDGLVTLGAATVEAIRSVRPDVCVLGVASLHPEAGLSVPDGEEACVKRAMIEVSAQVIGLADADKLGTVAPYLVAPAGELTHLVTDAVDETVLAGYRAQGISVISAPDRPER
ncbi:MAG TPA: DeoR/GlpR family DNA-binding transcription regulator [Streptosporangiaceae bacterium]|nr:DeoR/GlpR family DNA-binding transcription regulator [Streptosporangiaceae bacterium]